MNNVERLFERTEGPADFARGYFEYLASVFDRVDQHAVGQFIEVLEKARAENRTVFFFGNGGSAATASHFQNDLTRWRTEPMRVMSLTDNVAVISALANDYGYEHIFVMQLETLLRPDDVVVAISASGNSPNVVNAIEFANQRDATTVGLTGFDGGRLADLVDVHVHVPTDAGEYGPVEDVHMAIDHLVMSYLWEKWTVQSRLAQ
jgi:D-sedoheptulose 7-phosphate isomerase